MRSNFVIFLQGMIMGIAEIIPGVSGSTLALVMGIYEKFIDLLHDISQFLQVLIKAFLGKSSKKEIVTAFKGIDWKFGLILLMGMAVAIAIASTFIEWAIASIPHLLLASFSGLIVASIIVPFRQITKFTPKIVFLIVLSAIVVFLLLGLKPVSAIDAPSYIALFLGGMVAISGMVLPGVSGSFILLLVGLYEYITSTIKQLTHFEVSIERLIGLMVFGLGLVVGFMGFVKILKLLLEKWKGELMAVITGLMIGSLRTLWPFIDLSMHDAGTELALSEYSKVLPWEMQSQDLVYVTIALVISFSLVQVLLQVSRPKKTMTEKLADNI